MDISLLLFRQLFHEQLQLLFTGFNMLFISLDKYQITVRDTLSA